jgi:hypothetical protein
MNRKCDKEFKINAVKLFQEGNKKLTEVGLC